MALARTVSSNATGLYRAREEEPGKIPQGAKWEEVEPNEYGDTGSTFEKSARQPINSSRQRKKATALGKSARIGFTQDITPFNCFDAVEEFLFAAARRKAEAVATAVTATGYTVAGTGLPFVAGTLIKVTGASNPAHNGLKVVSEDSTANEIKATGLSVAAGQAIQIVAVGFEFPADDAAISIVGTRPALTTTVTDLSGFGLIPGESVWIGGDAVASRFALEARANGFARVFSVGANAIIFDKTDAAMVADVGAGKSIRIFFGRVVKNELYALQKTFTTSFRQMLGAPDREYPEKVQSRVITRAVANEMTITIPSEDRCTMELAYLAGDEILIDDDATTDATGELVPADEADAYNSSSDQIRSSLHVYNADGSLTELFSVIQEGDITINNNVQEVKAVTNFGTYDLNPGTFEVDASLTCYFVTLDSLRAIQENKGVTYFAAWTRENMGLAFELPYGALSTDGLAIELNETITLPLDNMASTGRSYSKDMDFTAMFVFFDYLPTVAGDKF